MFKLFVIVGLAGVYVTIHYSLWVGVLNFPRWGREGNYSEIA
jgi:hypothetical protein